MAIGNFQAIFAHHNEPPIAAKKPLWKHAVFAAGLGLSILSYPVHAAQVSSSDTVESLYQALLSTMKNGRILGQSGRFAQLEPVILRNFDITSMARLSVGSTWISSERGAASADERELRTLYRGDLCRPLR